MKQASKQTNKQQNQTKESNKRSKQASERTNKQANTCVFVGPLCFQREAQESTDTKFLAQGAALRNSGRQPGGASEVSAGRDLDSNCRSASAKGGHASVQRQGRPGFFLFQGVVLYP